MAIKPLAKKYGNWTVIRRDPSKLKNAICRCKCGAVKSVDVYFLKNKRSLSCGCLTRPLRKNIAGDKFGKLTVLSIAKRGHGYVQWNCICECGNKAIVGTSNLVRGVTKSCGCMKKSQKGLSRDPLYSTWISMLARCHDKSNFAYHYYGARGIKVCREWHDYKTFVNDMSPKKDGCTLDRIDNNKGYSRENCRWATPKQQRINQYSRVHMVNIGDKSQCLSDWIKELGLVRGRVYARVSRGWSYEESLFGK